MDIEDDMEPIEDEIQNLKMKLDTMTFEVPEQELGFPHKEEYAYGEVRSYREFQESEGRAPDYFLVDKEKKKIVAGYASYNIPNYSQYTGKDNKSKYEIWHASTMKNPQPYLNQFPLDYTDENNWLT